MTGVAGRLRRIPVGDLGNRYGLVIVWAALILLFSLLRPHTFFTGSNFATMFGSQSVLLIVTLGLLVALTAGELDLSISGVLGFSQTLVGYLTVLHGWPIWAAIIAALGTGIAVGIVNAALIVRLGVDGIVVTLGTGTLMTGAAFALTYLTIGGISNALVTAVSHQLFGIQAAFYYALALTLAIWYVFKYTPLGRYLYFVGQSRDVARLAGLPVQTIRSGALVTSSLLAAAAGIVLAGLLGSSDPNAGAHYLLPAFAGAFLGSTVVTPGRFNPIGAFVAVYFLVTGITGLELLGFSGWIEQVFYGGSLAIAAAFSRLAAVRRRGGTG